MNKFWGHLKTITHHRHLVMRGCFRMGLIWQGLTHDLSKYSPTEFFAGVRYFQGSRSPNTAEREANGETVFEVRVADGDMGKVIGRQGRIAKEIRTVVRSYAQRTGVKVSVDIVD